MHQQLKFALPIALLSCAAVSLVAHAGPVPGQGTWETTLLPRDVDGDGRPDAYYDTVLNITWLPDANYMRTSGGDGDGKRYYDSAQTWLAVLNYYQYLGMDDWRMPRLTDLGLSGCHFAYTGTDCGYNVLPESGELAHLFYVTLGNRAYYDTAGNPEQPGWGLTNTGPFRNLQAAAYWYEGGYQGGFADFARFFFSDGWQQGIPTGSYNLYTWAVRDGDIGVDTPADPRPARGTWETSLEPRDVDNDGIVDAYYDTNLDITWLADANYAVTSVLTPWEGSPSPRGELIKSEVDSFIAVLNRTRYLGVSTWRLPQVTAPDAAGCELRDTTYLGLVWPVYCIDFDPDTGELAHLYYETLGNVGKDIYANEVPPTNWGPFINYDRRNYYWTGTKYPFSNASRPMYWTLRFATGERRPSSFSDYQAWPVMDGDIGEQRVQPSGPTVFCPGDINADGQPDIVAIDAAGRIQVKGLDGSAVADFIAGGMGSLVDAELLDDVNSNGAPELALLGAGSPTVQVRDLLTGALLNQVQLDAATIPVDLELVPDQMGNSFPELAVLDAAAQSVPVFDAISGSPLTMIALSDYVAGRDLEVYPDFGISPGRPLLAVLGNNGGVANGDVLQIRSLATGALVHDEFLNKQWQVLQHELVTDIDGDGQPEVAILRQNYGDDRKQVAVLNPFNNATKVRYLGFDRAYVPSKLMTITDINGNRSDEVVVFGPRYDGRNQKAKIRDSKTRVAVNTVFFDKNFAALDIAVCADMNGNGAQELVMLGHRADYDKTRAIIKDAKTSALIGKVDF